MDKEQLKQLLQPFVGKCRERGYPLSDLCLEEAYPGDDSTSYIVLVKSDWIDDMSCSKALDILFDALWETTDVNTREKVFSFQLVNQKQQLKCASMTAPLGLLQ